MDNPSAKELYQSQPGYDVGRLREDDYPASELAEAVEASGLSYAEIARRLGWMHPDTQRVRAAVGLTRAKDGYVRKAVRYETAVKIIRALDLDPMDYGL